MQAGEVRLRVAEWGEGPPLVLLHGWPEFWLTWEPVMRRLGDRFRLVAPDLRGFGDSAKFPAGRSDQVGPDRHAADLVALLDALGLKRAGLVGHDVGAYVLQAAARVQPARFTGLFFFNLPHPGVGARLAAARHLPEIWYQSFHLLPWAAELVGRDRETCRLYLQHFLRHWAYRRDAFDDVLERWVDEFMRPGNLQGGFNWYVSTAAARRAMIEGTAPTPAPIAVPACVRWGEHDPVLPAHWLDGAERWFAALDGQVMPGVGHFPHREDPERAAAEIARFFTGRG